MTTPSVILLISDQLVDCIANDRDPTVHELFALAERIWTDAAGLKSAFTWDRLPRDTGDRLFALRAAQLALRGSKELLDERSGDSLTHGLSHQD